MLPLKKDFAYANSVLLQHLTELYKQYKEIKIETKLIGDKEYLIWDDELLESVWKKTSSCLAAISELCRAHMVSQVEEKNAEH